MDQTFDFRAAPVPLRRRLRPRAIALLAASAIAASGLGWFSRLVVESERRSLERAEHAGVATSIVGTISGADGDLDDPNAFPAAIDEAARSDVRAALDAARRAASGRATFLDAGPGQLGAIAGSLVVVDGPSPAPGVVSVTSTRYTWGAAMMGPSGTCYWVRFSPANGTSFGTGRACTGEAALAARDASW